MNEIQRINENPETVHGRLLESVHISGYSLERACSELEWLIEENRWQSIGQSSGGFKDIDAFLATIDFSEFKIAIEQRKKLARKLANLRATQRAIAQAVGVSVGTVNEDLKPVQNRTKTKPEPSKDKPLEPELVQNRTPPPTAIVQSGQAVAKLAEKATVKAEKKEERKAAHEEKEAEALSKITTDKTWEITNDPNVIQCHALITDPPYGILGEPWEPEQIEQFTREWASRWAKCDADIVLVFFSQRYLWEARQWFDESLDGYTFQQLLIWHYANNKSPQSRMGFKQTWEPIFFYRRNETERKIEVSGSAWGDGLNDFDCHCAAVPQSNFNDADRKVHPAQKPASVMRWLINACTQPGELVVDPFCGSGTTGIAATQLNRLFHGIENDDEMAEIARKRIATYGGQLPELKH